MSLVPIHWSLLSSPSALTSVREPGSVSVTTGPITIFLVSRKLRGAMGLFFPGMISTTWFKG